MKKHKIHIEKELNCKSANIIWPLLSSSGGLAKWFADYVERNDDQLTFTWGEPWTHQETRSATITEEVVAHQNACHLVAEVACGHPRTRLERDGVAYPNAQNRQNYSRRQRTHWYSSCLCMTP